MGNRKQAIALALFAVTGTISGVATQTQENHNNHMVRNFEKEGEDTTIAEVTENGITLSGTKGPDGAMITYTIDPEAAGITSSADVTSVTWNNGSDTIAAEDAIITPADETGLTGTVQFKNFDSEVDLDIVGTIESKDEVAPTRKQTTTPHLKFKTLQNATVNITNTTKTTTGAIYEATFVIAESDVTDWNPSIKSVSVVDSTGVVVESNISDLLTEENPTINKQFEVTGLNPGETKTLLVKYTYQAREGATEKTTTISLGELTALLEAAKPVENVQVTAPEETITQTTAVINGTFDIPQDEGYEATTVSEVKVEGEGTIGTVNLDTTNGTFDTTISDLTAGTSYKYTITVIDNSNEDDVITTVDIKTKELEAALEPTLNITAEAIDQLSANINYDLTIPEGSPTTDATKVDSIVVTGDNEFPETTLTDITSGEGKTQKVEGLKAGTQYNLTATIKWSGVKDTTSNTKTETFTLLTNSKVASDAPEVTATTEELSQTSVTVNTTYKEAEGNDLQFGSEFVSAELSGTDITDPINIENNTATVTGLTAGQTYSDWKVTFKYNNGVEETTIEEAITPFTTLDKIDADAPTITVGDVTTTQHTVTFNVDVKEFEPGDPASQNSSKVTGITLSGTDTNGVTINNTGGEVTVNGLKEATPYSDWKLTTTWEGSSSATPVETKIDEFTTSDLINANPVTGLKIDTTTPTYNGGIISGSFVVPTNDENTQETIVSDVKVTASVEGQDITDVKTNWTSGDTNFSADITGVEPGKEVSVTVTVTGNWTEETTTTGTFTTSNLESAQPITELNIVQESVTYNSAKVSGSFKTPNHIDGTEDTRVDSVVITTTAGDVNESWTAGDETFSADITGLTAEQTAKVTVTVTGNFATQTAEVDVTTDKLADAKPITDLVIKADSTDYQGGIVSGSFVIPDNVDGVTPTEVTSVVITTDKGNVEASEQPLDGNFSTAITGLTPNESANVTVTVSGNWGEALTASTVITASDLADATPITEADITLTPDEQITEIGEHNVSYTINKPAIQDGIKETEITNIEVLKDGKVDDSISIADKTAFEGEFIINTKAGDNHSYTLRVTTNAPSNIVTSTDSVVVNIEKDFDTGSITETSVVNVKDTTATVSFNANLNPNPDEFKADEMTVSAGKYHQDSQVVGDGLNKIELSGLTPKTTTEVTLTFTHSKEGVEPTTVPVTITTTSSGSDKGTVSKAAVVSGSETSDSAKVSFDAVLNPNPSVYDPDTMTVSAGSYLKETLVKEGTNTVELTGLPVNAVTDVVLTFTHSDNSTEPITVKIKTKDVPFSFTAKIDSMITENGTNSILFTIASEQNPDKLGLPEITAKVDGSTEHLKVDAIKSKTKGISEQYKISEIDPAKEYRSIKVSYGDTISNLTDKDGNEISKITGGEIVLKNGGTTTDSSWLTTGVIIEIVIGTILLITIPLVAFLIYKKKNA